MGALILFWKTFYLPSTKHTKIWKTLLEKEIIGNLIKKLGGMIEEGVKKGTYKKTEDKTLQDLKNFKIFCTGTSIHTNIVRVISFQVT